MGFIITSSKIFKMSRDIETVSREIRRKYNANEDISKDIEELNKLAFDNCELAQELERWK